MSVLQKLCSKENRREVYSFPKWLKEKGSEVQKRGSVRTNKHRYHAVR